MKNILSKRILLAGLAGLVVGIMALTAVRFVLASDESVHYHANFAVYVDGQREQFDSFTFYEEIQACGDDYANNPRARAHLHDQINHVIHIHNEGVTWGNFFENIGYTLGNDVLTTDDGVYTDSDDGQLTFRLNGQDVTTIANQNITSEDVLLISFGNDNDEELQQRYENIEKNAAEYNQKDDPSSCSGGQGFTTTERLQHAIGL
jgi:hypothetical protein